MHYYQFHIGDYKSHTSHLSVVEDCAYRRLLDFYYLNERPINQRDIARQINMRDYEQDVLTVLNEFFISTPDGFTHPRADREITAYKEHLATSAWGAFIRDNPKLKLSADKKLFIDAYLRGGHQDYISGLCVHDVPIKTTHTTHDATNNHKPLTTNQLNTPDGVDNLVWQDWVSFRKKRRAPVTDRVIEGLIKEGQIAGMTLNQVLTECVVSGWQSFKGEWILARQKQNQNVATVTTPTPANHDAALRKIEEDSKRAAPIPDNIREKMAELLGNRK